MKKVIELELEYSGETKQYLIFKIKKALAPPPLFPAKIYLLKDLFKKETKNIMLTIEEKEN